MGPSLSAEQVSVSFEGLNALSNVSLDVPREKVTGLIGPNGAGKTTLVNVLTGFQAPSAGRILLDGEEIGGTPPHRIRRRGVARTFQSGRLFADLSVARQSRGDGRRPGAVAARCGRQGRGDARAGSASGIWPNGWRAACPTPTSGGSRSAAP